MRKPDRRSRFVLLFAAVALVTGIAATSASAAPALPACKVADTLTKYRGYAYWNRSLLDLTYRLPSTYAPGDLRSTSLAGLNGGFSVRSLVVADLKSMAWAARVAGARFAVQSAFRSYATQKSTFAYWVRVHGYATALKESARAGHSEHQLGTTLDLKAYNGKAPWDYSYDWATTKVGAWLKNNSWKYGFVISYPKGKSGVTCYQYEPWHFRYLGRARARAVQQSGLPLREFLWREQNPTPTPTPAPTPTPTPTPAPTPTPTPTPDPGG